MSLLLLATPAGPLPFATDKDRPPAAEEDTGNPTAENRSGGGETGFRKHSRTFLDDGKYLLTFPSRPTRRGVFITASVVGATAYLVTRDEELRDWLEGHRSETTGDLERIFEPIGRAGSGFVITGGGWLLGRFFGRDRLRRTSAVAFESFVYTGVITAAAKGLFARERPDEPGSTGQFWEGESAFPSGHTSRTFAIASVFAESYGPRAAWVAYPIATLVGLARLEDSTHWASDVLAGGALGIVIGKALARRHDLRPDDRSSGRRRGARYAMMAGPGGFGVRIHLGP
ncbi:MAG: phosphatase PAP2 family protein [Acidobacteria bacterium]|nr:phosphatase PAP2 family protein [Acidobacteriota bacterium]